MKASVVEFYSPGRFFIVAQSPELLGALNSISTELQKTYSCPSVTTYVPCTEEVCAVQFSCDLVRVAFSSNLSRWTSTQICSLVQSLTLTLVFSIYFSTCRTGTGASSRLWLLTRRRLMSFTLILAMKKMFLWKGSGPWLLISQHSLHV